MGFFLLTTVVILVKISFLFKNLDSEYLMAFNIGAIWNVITLWVHRGMTDTPESVKKNISQYLIRMTKVSLF